ncbi:MAG: hypothetical protein AVDCRST_MAG49-2601, partial [uncultured Thermomicrobiales bacterium]
CRPRRRRWRAPSAGRSWKWVRWRSARSSSARSAASSSRSSASPRSRSAWPPRKARTGAS